MEIDADAVLWREVEDEGARLLVLLHGVGSHEGDLFGLVPHLPANLNIASLRAPLPWPNGGRAWFELGFSADGQITYDADQVRAAGQAVVDWLESVADRFPQVALLGFSQGAATSLQVASVVPDRIERLVMLSGLLPFGEDVDGPRQLKSFIAIGDQDEVIGARSASLERWASENLDAEVHHYPIGHYVFGPELADLNAFLVDWLG